MPLLAKKTSTARDLAARIMDCVAALRDMEKDLPKMEEERSGLIRMMQNGSASLDTADAFQSTIEGRQQVREALVRLDVALKNSASSFTRLDQKAAKDAQALNEFKKRMGASAFDDRDPILIKQRDSFERAIQKLEYVGFEIEKLREMLKNKYGRGPVELTKLADALNRDFKSMDGFDSPVKQCTKALKGKLGLHHLPKD